MPLYEYACKDGHLSTDLRKYEDRDAVSNCRCGHPLSRLVSAPAKTAWSWGDSKWDGYHDRGLNMTLRDQKHREQVMRQRGLREVNDGEVENEIRRATSEHEKHERDMNKFQTVLRDTGSTATAMAQTFPDAGRE
jgi:putative FmdB family regulatory protein